MRHPKTTGRRQRHTSRIYIASKEGDVLGKGSHGHLMIGYVQQMYIVWMHVSAGDLWFASY